MPWCETCEQYLAPNALSEKGQCPECGAQCGESKKSARFPILNKKIGKFAWHLWVLIFVLGGYLCWRLIQLIMWIFS